jgi:hypothetical protein
MQVKLGVRVLILLFAAGWPIYSRIYCSPLAVPFAVSVLGAVAYLDIVVFWRHRKLEQQRVAEKIRMS